VTPADVHYTSGTWVAIVSPTQWLLVDLAPDDERLENLWAARSSGMEEVLDILLRQGLRSLPGFVFVEIDGQSTRYVVRQPASLSVSSAASAREINSTQQGLWDQGPLDDDLEGFQLVGGTVTEELSLPVREGIAMAATISVASGSAIESHVTLPRHASAATAEQSAPEVGITHVEVSANDESDDDNIAVGSADLRSPQAIEPSPAASDAEEASEEPVTGDHSDMYYKLLVSSTVDRDALLAQLREDEVVSEQPSASPVEPDGLVEEAEPEAQEGPDSTRSWDPDELAPPVPLSSEDTGRKEPTPTVAPGKPLIDGVPWLTGEAPADPPSGRAPTPPVAPTGSSLPPFHPMSGPGSLPTTPATSATAPQVTPGASLEDVDPTAVTTNRQALLNALTAGHQVGPTVLAVQCPLGHPNPVYAPACRNCGAQIAEQTPREIPRPSLGRLTVSNGSVVTLDRGVVFGRFPESDIVDPAERPHLVRLVDSTEISRMHASVTLEGWQLLLRDLGSSNGTLITVPGGEPVMVRPMEDHPLEPGSTVSLADVVSFTYEVTT